MSDDVLNALKDRIDEDIDGLQLTPGGLESIVDSRYGEVTLHIDHDEEAESLRVMVCVPPPAGAGPDFLVWALSTNTQYWDVKLGLDDDGELCVHADLDVEEDTDYGALGAQVIDRVETILELLDTDLVEWLLEHDLGTPVQRGRWTSREPAVAEED